jgi:hypothetical protein
MPQPTTLPHAPVVSTYSTICCHDPVDHNMNTPYQETLNRYFCSDIQNSACPEFMGLCKWQDIHQYMNMTQ